MLARIFPDRFDNDYRGHPVALWAFYPLTFVTLARSLVHIFFADGGAQSIATIPLDTMTSGGASGIILFFGLWGLSQLLLAVIYVMALWRYRTLLPLLYVLMICEYVGRFLLGQWKPIVTLETPPGSPGNFVFMAVAAVMLVLSLRPTLSAVERSAAERELA